MAIGMKVTSEGLEKLQAELKHLEEVERKKVIEDIETARGYGDLSENSEYDEAKTRQGKIEGRIQELKEILANVIVVDEIHTDAVDVGTIVTVYNQTRGAQFEYTIVGATEANPLKGKISDRSPIGKALMGCRKGAKVEVETPSGIVVLEILDISK
ncbi:MAG: transcription elongation factor GreA [Clostridia bacterium]|nr:transcription elongation factor GreA [Clostridia bacterium]